MPQAVPLTQFLATAGGAKTSWADEEVPDTAPLPSYARGAPSAPAPAAPQPPTKAIPTVGPFVVFVGNVSYDIEQARSRRRACVPASTLGAACGRRRAPRPRHAPGGGDRAGELTWRPPPARSATWKRRSRNAGCVRARSPNCQPMLTPPPPRAQCKEFRIIRHRDTDRPRGCFITVESAEGVAKALTLDNTLLRGRPLRVDVAEAKPERNSGARALCRPRHARFAAR